MNSIVIRFCGRKSVIRIKTNAFGRVGDINKKTFSVKKEEMSLKHSIEEKMKTIPDMKTFIRNDNESIKQVLVDNLDESPTLNKKTFFIETYGCQMNSNDSEIVSAILTKANYLKVSKIEEADIVLTNTCSIRESAEDKVWNNIQHYKGIKRRNKDKIFGILGCMAERMKEKILQKSDNVVDLIVGPDAYRELPAMLNKLSASDSSCRAAAVDVKLSFDETYRDIFPALENLDSNSVKAYVSIMRGCNNMCSFCIVPFTRGRERSRDFESILDEVKMLRDKGIKEITLLGQNVNSYLDESSNTISSSPYLPHQNSSGFNELFKLRNKPGLRFTELIEQLSEAAPEVRFRFTSPHPKDFPERLIDVIKTHPNICKQLHLPVQSGNNKVLNLMRRYYTREAYFDLVDMIRSKIPSVALSSDFIAGFCGESEEDFNDTVTLIEKVKYDMAFLFAYSMRERTHAYHNLQDDVAEAIKKERLSRMIAVFRKQQLELNKQEVGRQHIVLVENEDRKGGNNLFGRTDTNKLCIFQNKPVGYFSDFVSRDEINPVEGTNEIVKPGEYVLVHIDDASNNTLYGSVRCKIEKMSEFFIYSNNQPYLI